MGGCWCGVFVCCVYFVRGVAEGKIEKASDSEVSAKRSILVVAALAESTAFGYHPVLPCPPIPPCSLRPIDEQKM